MKKNKFILYGFFFCFLWCANCTNCTNDANVDSQIITDKNTAKTQEETDSIEDTQGATNKPPGTNEEDEIENPESKEKPIADEVIKKSSCEILYDTYKESVEKYVASKEMSDLDVILNFSNNETFENCRKDKAYRKKFDVLDERMESVEN